MWQSSQLWRKDEATMNNTGKFIVSHGDSCEKGEGEGTRRDD
jgi:hypothetical protein